MGQDIYADDYREQYRLHGERIRWFKALPVAANTPGRERNGYLYQEQELDDAVRVLIFQMRDEGKHPVFGAVPSGSTMISVLPDEIVLGAGDRVVALDRALLARAQVTRGNGDTDKLANSQVRSIHTARMGATVYANGTDYEAGEDGIRWLAGRGPATGEKYSIEYEYSPLYVFLGVTDETARLDPNGHRLPQRGLLTQEKSL